MKQKIQNATTLKKKALEVRCDKVELAQIELDGLKMKNDSLAMASKDDAKQKQLIGKWLSKLESTYEKNFQPIEMDKIEVFSSTPDLPDFFRLSVDPFPEHELLLPEYICANKITQAVLFKGSTTFKHVSVQLESSKGEVTTADVQDNQDGSYSVSFTSKQAGKAKLTVYFDEQEIAGSPYSIEVYRNHKALNMPSKVIQESDI